jgi:hypothetical protein
MKKQTWSLVLKTLTATLIAVSTSTSFALDEGGAHGGGGDPRDLKQVVLASAMLTKIQEYNQEYKEDLVKVQGDTRPDGMNSDQVEQYYDLLRVQRWFEASAGFFQITKTMRYPLTNPVLQSLEADGLTKLLKNVTFRHGQNLKIDGNRVTFISDPSTLTVYVDYPRFKSFLDSQDNYDKYEEMSQDGIKMLTIALHEYLVLLRLEPSRTYRTSSTFGEPLTAMLSVEGFWLWAVKNLPFYSECPYMINNEYASANKFERKYTTPPTTVKPGVRFLLDFIMNNTSGRFWGSKIVEKKINENIEQKCAYLNKNN